MVCDSTSGLDQTLPGNDAPLAPAPACEAVMDEVRARGLAELASLQQRIDGAKRTLWALTAAARREPARIEAVIADIAALERSQQALFDHSIEAMMAERCAACRSGRAK